MFKECAWPGSILVEAKISKWQATFNGIEQSIFKSVKLKRIILIAFEAMKDASVCIERSRSGLLPPVSFERHGKRS